MRFHGACALIANAMQFRFSKLYTVASEGLQIERGDSRRCTKLHAVTPKGLQNCTPLTSEGFRTACGGPRVSSKLRRMTPESFENYAR